jgi:cytochrome c-type biogenesis protein CcmE
MRPERRRKLLFLIFSLTVLTIAAGLILYALRQNISLFYTPTQVVSGAAPINQSIRVGGMVEQGSIARAQKGLTVRFTITDYEQTIRVVYTGILPDLFREGQGIVAEGRLIDAHVFQASRVLAKHDANYMPPEVKAALANKVHS